MPPWTPHCLLLAALGTTLLLQADPRDAEWLGQAAMFLLLWSLASTLLVASLGAWIAWRRRVTPARRGGAPNRHPSA